MNETKKLITKIVKDYTINNKEEYLLFQSAMQMKKDTLRDEFGKPEGSEYHRALLELPEVLHNDFIMRLAVEQMIWFKSKEGAHWFARTFPLFCLPNKI